MRDPKEIEELEAQIARDKQRYSEMERLEAELMENIPQQGFKRSIYGRTVSRRKAGACGFNSHRRRDAGGSEKPAGLTRCHYPKGPSHNS